jgi:hypothetical protein
MQKQEYLKDINGIEKYSEDPKEFSIQIFLMPPTLIYTNYIFKRKF